MKSVILGTAGHIDHGKTALVKALTGVDTDRLEEERRRGISIELGFARLVVGDVRFGIVDVPGHERFVKNMLAGAGGIDLVVLVVAADEGVMPQTREHLDILDFLGVTHGLVVLTKRDLVDEESCEIAQLDAQEAVEGTTLGGATVVPVSSVTGEGLPELKQELVRLASLVPARSAEGPYRLPVDRVFVMEGFGTVVTGTSFAGRVQVGDRLELLPSRKTVRVRRVQVHGKDADEAEAGQRTALAIHGVSKEEVERGEQLVTPGSLTESSMVDVRVRVSPRWVRPLKNRERVRVHLASSEDLARIVLLDRDELAPGEDCLAQLRMETPLVPALGDRFVLRSYSPLHTMAGGTIVDPHPTKHRRYRPDELEAIEKREGGGSIALLREAATEGGLAGVKPKDLVKATSLSAAELDEAIAEEAAAGNLRVTANGRVLSGDVWRLAKRSVVEEGTRFRERHPLRWGMSREDARMAVGQNVTPPVLGELLDELVAEGAVRVNGDRIRVGDDEVVFEGAAASERARVIDVYRTAGLSAPDLKDVLAAAPSARLAEEVVASLVDQGELVKITDQIYYHVGAWNTAHAALKELEARDGSITVGAFRDHLQISRKYAVPVLEMFDARRITRREGDARRLLPSGG